MTIEEIIDVLCEKHNAEITKGAIHYSVTIWDAVEGCYQDLELTEDELIGLYEEYYYR